MVETLTMGLLDHWPFLLDPVGEIDGYVWTKGFTFGYRHCQWFAFVLTDHRKCSEKSPKGQILQTEVNRSLKTISSTQLPGTGKAIRLSPIRN